LHDHAAAFFDQHADEMKNAGRPKEARIATRRSRKEKRKAANEAEEARLARLHLAEEAAATPSDAS